MSKQEFIDELRARLSGLSEEDVEERISFYSEMIDDRVEEGVSEEEAILQIGSVEDIVDGILRDMPMVKVVKDSVKPRRRLTGWEIALIIVGAPIWLSILVSLVSAAFSVYVSLWAVVVSLWAVFGSLCAVSASGLLTGIGILIDGSPVIGLALMGAGLVCGGLSILMFFGSDGATKGMIALTKKCVLLIKKAFVRKERAE